LNFQYNIKLNSQNYLKISTPEDPIKSETDCMVLTRRPGYALTLRVKQTVGFNCLILCYAEN